MAKLVFNIKSVSSSDLRALSRHCSHRDADGWSSIDTDLSHLNRQLYGDAPSLNDSLDAWYVRTGSKRPAKQAERPYFSIVLSASPALFQVPEAIDVFKCKALAWLQAEFGDDLVFAELHLDETTPHIHAVVAPTYEKKPRVPGKRKKNQTAEEFESSRLLARSSVGTRTVGRSSSKWAYENSFDDLRMSAVEALEGLGIEYGQVLRKDQKASSTRQWVKERVSKLFDLSQAWRDRWSLLTSREEKLSAAASTFKTRAAALHSKEVAIDTASSELFLLHIQTRKLHTKLQEAFLGIRSALPWAFMKPDTRVKVERALADLSDVLKVTDLEIKILSKSAHKVQESLSDAMKAGPKIM